MAATIADMESMRSSEMDLSFKVMPMLLGICSGMTSHDFAKSSSALTVF